MRNKETSRRGERGNVLFLILIAVALFAALSYAVTQSTRSGSGSTEREQSILHGASMTQHPTAVRTAIIRMVLGGVDVSDLQFNAPANFGSLSANTQGVFHPTGGGAVYQKAPADIMVGSSQGTWYYNGNFEVPQIGSAGAGGNELVAFLPNVSKAVCKQINVEFSIDSSSCTETTDGIPDLNTGAASIRENMDESYSFPTTDQADLQGAGGCTALTGHASGCFNDTTNSEYVFYSVLLER